MRLFTLLFNSAFANLTGGFEITVRDTTAPVIALHADETAQATGPTGAAVSYSSPATSDVVDGAGTATCSPVSGSTFALGNTTVTCNATDAAGNPAVATMFVVHVVDTHAPAVTCGSADGSWHATDVSIACTANDGGSGLANAGDASFSLSTSVAAGTETANASTGSRNVCDVSGNCSTAGPIAGNKIDKKGPIGITFVGGPAAGGVYYFGSVPAAPTCTATDGGSGLLSCVVTGYSNAIGAQTLTATAKDNVLNSSTATLNFTVNSWSILGFYQPTDMGNVWNTVKNGSTVPLKFEVFAGSTELTNATLGVVVTSLTYKAATCSTAPVDDIELIATGNTTLRYDTTAGQYIYNWKTPSTPNACYVVTVTTVDGSKISANFKLK